MRYFASFVSVLLILSIVVYGEVAYAEKSNPPLASHLIFEYEDKAWQIDLSLFGFDGIDPTTVDRQALWDQLNKIAHDVERQPQNAYFDNRVIIPHLNGVRVDRGQLKLWINRLVSYQNKVLPLPVVQTEPEITTKMLSRIREKVLGSYTTMFNTHNIPRVNNVVRSSQAIDYVVVPPGHLFSFNETVGPRTRERGYLPAPIIVKGEYSEGIGGGICQTSSTLFNSVDQAGLAIVERVVHSKQVTYVPKGRDATVSWGGPDFKFRNDTNRPILIASDVSDGHITVTIYSASDVRFEPKKVPQPPKKRPQQEQSFTG